jgi:hypothetical protein
MLSVRMFVTLEYFGNGAAVVFCKVTACWVVAATLVFIYA